MKLFLAVSIDWPRVLIRRWREKDGLENDVVFVWKGDLRERCTSMIAEKAFGVHYGWVQN